MKKIPKRFYLAASLFLIWALVDFYHYAFIGNDLLAHYYGTPNIPTIRQLVANSLFQGIVKVLFALLILTAGWIKVSKKRKTLSSKTAITLLLSFSILGIWLVSMVCLTMVTAQEIYEQLYEASYGFPEQVESRGNIDAYFQESSQYQQENFAQLEYNIWNAMAGCINYESFSQGNYGYNGDRQKFIRSISYPMETAILFYDGNGNLLHSSQDNVLFFPYCTQAEWDKGMDSSPNLQYGWIDLEQGTDSENQEDPYRRFRNLYANLSSLNEIAAIRVTGFWEGTQLMPVIMHYVTETAVYQVFESTDQFSTGENSYSYQLPDVDKTGRLKWQLLFDKSASYKDSQLVTIYILHPQMLWDIEQAAITYQGIGYDSLAALTQDLDFVSETPLHPNINKFFSAGIYELDELLVFSGKAYTGNTALDSEDSSSSKPQLILITAVRSQPLFCALRALRNIYILTGMLAVILLFFVRSRIQKRLVQPVVNVTKALEKGWDNLYGPDASFPVWQEADHLRASFVEERDQQKKSRNEIARLKTALEYARTAEKNRRQMTSNLAHQLKTPLAVIHSYAEGLKEHIAENKREKYIDVILSEAERTDSMVLEMLDLSRLEAGKVTLSQDHVSLNALVRSIFEKLEMAVQAKNLQVELKLPEEFTITADESRLGQAVENFATNAIKYTPKGGHIVVRVQHNPSKTTFSIENDSNPLSSEALAKVWDTFYRTDDARLKDGAGLGLAIAKNIVELHGGTCSVENTKTGVKFSFIL